MPPSRAGAAAPAVPAVPRARGRIRDGLLRRSARVQTRKRPAAPLWRRLLPVLALLTAATRLPSSARPVWNPDEGYLATQARQLAAGGRLYDTVVDRKPPLLPLLYHGAFALFGDGSLWPLRVAAMVAVLAGAALAASTARRRWGERAAWAAGVLHVLLSVGLNPEDTQAATFEVFMVPCTVAAMWCADRGRGGGAGLAVAAAVLTKQTGGAVLVPVLFLLWRRRNEPVDAKGARAAWWALARLSAAAVLPVAGAALLFGPGRFAYWTATGSGAYLSATGAYGHALLRAAANGGVLALAAAPVLAALAVAFVRRRRPPHTADLWVWLAVSALATAVGMQFFGHYFLQLTPSLALLGAAAVAGPAFGAGPSAARAVLAGTALLTAGFVAFAMVAPHGEQDHARRLSAVVRQRTAPGDRVLVWGMHPEDYWLADRAPASRYLTAGFLTNFSGGRDGARVGERYAMDGAWPYFRRELRRRPPALVVDDARGKPYRAGRTPTLRAFLDRHYRRAGAVDGTVLYVRAGRPTSGTGRPAGR